jgi:hypothetical protein
MLGSRRPPYARRNQCREVLQIRTHTPTSCRRPGPPGVDETATLVFLATEAVKVLVRSIFLVPLVVSVPVVSGVPVVSVVPVILVLSADSKSVLIDTCVTSARLAAVGVDQGTGAGKTAERAAVPHRA